MAVSGPRRTTDGRRSGGEATRAALVAAAVSALRDVGFAGASAREIADRAGASQGSIFYHFGSVNGLLLAALDDVSAARMAAYSATIDEAESLVELVEAARTILLQDLAAGHTRFLVELIAGAHSVPGLGERVASRLVPWRGFAATAVRRAAKRARLDAVVPVDDVAHIVVAAVLGLELLTSLDKDHARMLALIDRARDLAALFEAAESSVDEPPQGEEVGDR